MSQRILFITPQVPYPPHSGANIRNYGMMQALADRGHRLALLSFTASAQTSTAGTPLSAICDPIIAVPEPSRPASRRLIDLLRGRVDLARRLWSDDFLLALQELLTRESFDVIQVSELALGVYMDAIREILAETAPHTRLILDELNVEYILQQRIAEQDRRRPSRWPQAIYSAIQAPRLKKLESRLLASVDGVLACSAQDADQIRRLSPHAPVHVIPNAVQIKAYQAIESAEIPHPALVYTGKMDYRPNVDAALWFAEDILPRIRAEVPAAHFTIVGQKPPARLMTLGAQAGISLTGWVDAVSPYLLASDVFVVPLRMGSGTRLKILEALAMGQAVVSTSVGAEGIDVLHGVHLLIADDEAAFANAVISLLANPEQGAALGAAGQALIREQYDWSGIAPQLEALYTAD